MALTEATNFDSWPKAQEDPMLVRSGNSRNGFLSGLVATFLVKLLNAVGSDGGGFLGAYFVAATASVATSGYPDAAVSISDMSTTADI